MKYMNTPPKLVNNPNIPPFLMDRFIINLVRDFIKWATSEYWSAMLYFTDQGDYRNIKFLTECCSDRSVLASHPAFKYLCRFLNDEKIWRKLNAFERGFIADAYGFVEA